MNAAASGLRKPAAASATDPSARLSRSADRAHEMKLSNSPLRIYDGSHVCPLLITASPAAPPSRPMGAGRGGDVDQACVQHALPGRWDPTPGRHDTANGGFRSACRGCGLCQLGEQGPVHPGRRQQLPLRLCACGYVARDERRGNRFPRPQRHAVAGSFQCRFRRAGLFVAPADHLNSP